MNSFRFFAGLSALITMNSGMLQIIDSGTNDLVGLYFRSGNTAAAIDMAPIGLTSSV